MRMFLILFSFFCVMINGGSEERYEKTDDSLAIDIIDLSYPTRISVMSEYYAAVEKNWKICIRCGVPGLGTAMHVDQTSQSSSSALYPAIIPTEYLITRLFVIDVSAMVRIKPAMVLTLDVALQWRALRHDTGEPAVLLFKFGWKESSYNKQRTCVCHIPGISYELAAWIAGNLTHVVGVATDAPTLESDETREMTSRTVSNLLGNSGIYMIASVNLKRAIPERGCMAIAMPLKLENTNFVPTRLTAFCPAKKTGQVVLTVKDISDAPKLIESRTVDLNLDEIMN